MPIQFGLVSLFPDMFRALEYGVVGRAFKAGLASMQCFNPRDFTTDVHKTVDDKPYGGGPGMVMRPEPLYDAITAAKKQMGEDTPVLYLSPQGVRLNQSHIEALASRPKMILLSGRYEGIDQRIILHMVDEEWSIGDYVLSGGELPTMVLMDAIIRRLPGALGDDDSSIEDSFMAGLLDYPHYTRPEVFRGWPVPDVLLSGHHEKIMAWRKEDAIRQTKRKRPDLIKND